MIGRTPGTIIERRGQTAVTRQAKASGLWQDTYRRVLTPDGTYVLIVHDHFGQVGRRWLGSLPRFLGLVLRSPFVRQLRGCGSRRRVRKA